MSMSGLAMTARASFTTVTPSPTRLWARATSRSATMVISMPRPARRLISSWLRRSTLNVPEPTTPMPNRPTCIGFIVIFFLIEIAVNAYPSCRVRYQMGSNSVGMAFAVVFQEPGQATDRLAQIVFMRQEHDAKVIRLRPVEAGALDQHDPGLLQQFQKE